MPNQKQRDWQASNLVQAVDVHTTPSDDLVPNRPTGSPIDDALDPRLTGAFTKHRSIVAAMTADLSDTLRCRVNGQISSINITSLDQWKTSLEFPACFVMVRDNANRGCVHIELRLAFAFIDKTLGGSPLTSDFADRELTDIESKILLRLAESFTNAWQTTWKLSDPMNLDSVRQVAEMSQADQDLIHGGDTSDWLCSTISLEFMGLRGNWSSLMPLPKFESTQPSQISTLHDLVATIDGTQMTRDQVGQLQVGDVIVLKHADDLSATLELSEVPLGRVEIGTTGGRKSIRISQQNSR